MQHSIIFIAKTYSEISDLRKDKERFSYEGFISFAKENKRKYSLIESGEDLLVSTWYSNELINDYRKTLKKSSDGKGYYHNPYEEKS